jgi:hypothetical protein
MERGSMSKATSSKTSSTSARKQAVSPLLILLEWAERQNLDLPSDLSEKHDAISGENLKKKNNAGFDGFLIIPKIGHITAE